MILKHIFIVGGHMFTKYNRSKYVIILLIFIQIVTTGISVYYIDKYNRQKRYLLQENRNTLRNMKECIEDANIVLTRINRKKELIAEDIATLNYDYQIFTMGMHEMDSMYSFTHGKESIVSAFAYYNNIYNYLTAVDIGLQNGNRTYRESYDKSLYGKMHSITKLYMEVFRKYDLDTIKDILPILKEIEEVNNNPNIIGGFHY